MDDLDGESARSSQATESAPGTDGYDPAALLRNRTPSTGRGSLAVLALVVAVAGATSLVTGGNDAVAFGALVVGLMLAGLLVAGAGAAALGTVVSALLWPVRQVVLWWRFRGEDGRRP
jgi:uncharacterized membrane protein